MRKTLLSLAMLIMTVMTATAQYTVEIESAPEKVYFSGEKLFDATEIATALGYGDAQTFFDALASKKILYANDEHGELTNAYNGNPGESVFWMNEDAKPLGPGDASSCFYVGLFRLGEQLSVRIGQKPNYFMYDPFNTNFTLYLKNEDKQVTFDVTFTLLPFERPDIQAPALKFSELEIVKEYSMEVNYIENKPNPSIVTETLNGIYGALEIESTNLDKGIQAVVTTREYSGEPAALTDNMVVVATNPQDGWFGRYQSNGEPLPLNGPHFWGAGCTMYIHDIALADGKFSFLCDQYVGTMKAGDSDRIELYICNGTKAAKLTINIVVSEPEKIPFNEMTKAGEQIVNVEAEVNNDYAAKPFGINMPAVLEALGVAEVTDFYAWAAEEELSNIHNENSGGFYYNKNGYIQGWGADAAFFVSVTSMPEGRFAVGQMPNGQVSQITEPTTVSADLIFLGTDKYYLVKLNYTVKPVTKTIPATKLASFSCISNVEVPDGVIVYKAAVEGSTVVLTPVETNVIPKNTGVILYSETLGEKMLRVTAAAPTGDFTGNQLVAATGAAAPANTYALMASEQAFAKVKEGTEISYGKAYLTVPAAGAQLRVVFEGEATGIETVEENAAENSDCYTLQGVKVAAPAKGIYIRNGKKVYIK